MDDFFVEFFSGTQPNDFDRNVGIRPQAAQLNHLTGEVDNFYRLAHVEHINAASSGIGPRSARVR